MWEHRADVAIVGVGHSPVLRRDDGTPEHSLGALALAACQEALADAGLDAADVDGISSVPSQPFSGAGEVDGVSRLTTAYLVRELGLTSTVWSDDTGVMAGHSMLNAIEAVAVGIVEGFGLCPAGEALGYFRSGNNAIDGEHPLNTCGDNLGAGRVHGVAHLLEAVLQIQGRAGRRQVADAAVSLAVTGPPNRGQAS